MKKYLLAGAVIAGLTSSNYAMAQEDHSHHNHQDHMPQNAELMLSNMGHDHHHGHKQFSPISIMGDHVHKEGGWMLSYRYMGMKMKGNRDGTNDLDPTEISGDYPNVTNMGPTTLRIVPVEMRMRMHMLGAMYGVTNDLTLMAMGNYRDKEMEVITFAAMNADQEIARFSPRSEGFGDVKLSALYNLYQEGSDQIVIKAGVSLPTGNLDEEGDMINPMGVQQRMRMAYSMQNGTGTYDFEPAVTYTGNTGNVGWGLQYQGSIRLEDENSEGYSFGDVHKLSAWAGYHWQDWLATTLRITGETEGKINGQDSQIAGPTQTSDPDNYGGDRVEIGLGLNLTGKAFNVMGHSFGGEFVMPIHQDLNGPQMKRDYGFTLGYKYMF